MAYEIVCESESKRYRSDCASVLTKTCEILYHERGVSAWLITSSLKTLKKSELICVSFMCMALRAEQNMMPRVHAPKMMNAAGWRAGWETTCGSRRRRKERTFSCR